MQTIDLVKTVIGIQPKKVNKMTKQLRVAIDNEGYLTLVDYSIDSEQDYVLCNYRERHKRWHKHLDLDKEL